MKQKVIKIGTSAGVTIPKKVLEDLDLQVGDEIKFTVEPVAKKDANQNKLMNEYKEFTSQYGSTLKNLADR